RKARGTPNSHAILRLASSAARTLTALRMTDGGGCFCLPTVILSEIPFRCAKWNEVEGSHSRSSRQWPGKASSKAVEEIPRKARALQTVTRSLDLQRPLRGG